MSSPYGSANAIGAGHDAYTLVLSPQVEIAIWAIILAIAVALVLVVAEMVKHWRADNGMATIRNRQRHRSQPKKPEDKEG